MSLRRVSKTQATSIKMNRQKIKSQSSYHCDQMLPQLNLSKILLIRILSKVDNYQGMRPSTKTKLANNLMTKLWLLVGH